MLKKLREPEFELSSFHDTVSFYLMTPKSFSYWTRFKIYVDCLNPFDTRSVFSARDFVSVVTEMPSKQFNSHTFIV